MISNQIALALAFVHIAGSIRFSLVVDGESPMAFICAKACCTDMCFPQQVDLDQV